jgi:hypothetical protein
MDSAGLSEWIVVSSTRKWLGRLQKRVAEPSSPFSRMAFRQAARDAVGHVNDWHTNCFEKVRKEQGHENQDELESRQPEKEISAWNRDLGTEKFKSQCLRALPRERTDDRRLSIRKPCRAVGRQQSRRFLTGRLFCARLFNLDER